MEKSHNFIIILTENYIRNNRLEMSEIFMEFERRNANIIVIAREHLPDTTNDGDASRLLDHVPAPLVWRDYTPDFVIRRKDGKCLLVEIKKSDSTIEADLKAVDTGEAGNTTEGRKHAALKRWETLNPDKLRYQMVTVKDGLPLDAADETMTFVK